MKGYEVTPRRTAVSHLIWKYQLCDMTSVTVRVYSKKLSLPVGSVSGSVTFKLAHLLEPEETISVYVLFFCFFFFRKIAAYFVPIAHIGETNIDCDSERVTAHRSPLILPKVHF